jgi:hypothetical protein
LYFSHFSHSIFFIFLIASGRLTVSGVMTLTRIDTNDVKTREKFNMINFFLTGSEKNNFEVSILCSGTTIQKTIYEYHWSMAPKRFDVLESPKVLNLSPNFQNNLYVMT